MPKVLIKSVINIRQVLRTSLGPCSHSLVSPTRYFCISHRGHLPSSELARLKLLLEEALDRANSSTHRHNYVQMQFWLF